MNHTNWMSAMTETKLRLQPWTLPEVAIEWFASPTVLATLAEEFSPISLKEMDAVALLNRTDIKYLLTLDQVLNVLSDVKDDYQMLSVNGHRLNHYRTLYFDTPDFQFYNLHVNERGERFKVRSREYADSNLSFLEVKHKNNKGRTIKDRICTSKRVIQINQESENWLNSYIPCDSRTLEPKIWNTFTRITLASIRYGERVTLDVDLTFYAGNKVVRFDGLAVVEVKQDETSKVSPIMAEMRNYKIHPSGFSKYCIGVAMLYDQVKKNSLKPKLLRIKKLAEGVTNHE